MPRKGHTQKRDVLADPLYNNKVVTKLINNIMLDGKRALLRRSYTARLIVSLQNPVKEAVEVFEEAMNNIMPVLEVKAKRIGGATYQDRSRLSRKEDRLLHFAGSFYMTRATLTSYTFTTNRRRSLSRGPL